MRIRRAIWITLLCAALVGALGLPYPVLANSVTVTFDAGGWADYTIVHGTLGAYGNPNQGLYGGSAAGNCNAFPASYTVNRVDFVLNAVYTITGFAYDHKESGGGSTGGVVILYDSSNVVLATYTPAYTGSTTWHTYSNSSISVAGVKKVSIQNSACGGAGYQVYLDNASITATDTINPTNTPTVTPTATLDPSAAGWNKPLRGSEQKLDDRSFHPGRYYASSVNGVDFTSPYNLNVGFSAAPYQNVYAVQEGTIDSVLALGACAWPSTWVPSGYCRIAWNTEDVLNELYALFDNVFLVTEALADGRFVSYIVFSPQVVAGSAVKAGCWIGNTLPLKKLTYDLLSNQPIQAETLAYGAVFVQGMEPDGTSTFDLSPFLISEPSGIACSLSPSAECPLVANPDFATMWGWTKGFDPTDPDLPLGEALDGLQLPAYAQQTLNIDPAAQYTIHVVFQLFFGSATGQNFFVNLGATEHQILVDPNAGSMQERLFPAASYAADREDGLFTLSVKGHSHASQYVSVKFVCVSDANDKPPAPGGGCLVLDPNFSITGSDSPWGKSGLAGLAPGYASLPHNAFIQQALTLHPKAGGGEQQYTLSVAMRRQGDPETGKSIGIAWSFDAQNGSLDAASDQTLVTRTDLIAISASPITSTLILTASGSDAEQVAYVERVCLTTADGSNTPGYRPPPPFEAGCRFCVYAPTGTLSTDFSEFVHWLSCQLYQLWECQAKILLRYIWTTLVNILTLLGFFRLWLSATLLNLVAWGNGNLQVFLRWLDGQISNAVANLSLAILNWHDSAGGGGATIWDFLIALVNGLVEILKALVSLVGSIVQLILSGIIGFLVNGLGGFLGMIQSVLNGIAASSSQVQVDWLPNCSDPQSALFVICAASAGIEQELSLTPIPMLVPVILGAGAFGLIWWAINRFVRAVTGEGE